MSLGQSISAEACNLPGSNRSLTFIKDWLNNCLSSHLLCRKLSVFQAPTRLLEIYEGGVRLCLPRFMSMCPLYLTLSHCWGSMNTLKLMKSNVDSFLREIPVQDLCNTFLDALIVTQTLGFDYLWIDSLCIIQDDLADWRRESTLMSEVYGNAVLNIAATHANNGSAGLFIKRHFKSNPTVYPVTQRRDTRAVGSIPLQKMHYRGTPFKTRMDLSGTIPRATHNPL